MSKFFLGFGIVFIIFMGVVFFSYNGLSKMGKDFSSYNEIANEQELAAKIESNLLYCRIAFKAYVDTGDSLQENEFKDRYQTMEQLIIEYKETVADEDRTKGIDYIAEQAKQYNIEFDNVVELRSKKDEIYNDILITKGDELINKLTLIMNAGFNSKNEVVAQGSAEAVTNFAMARVYAVKYLETHDKTMIEKVNTSFTEMDTAIKKIEEPVRTLNESSIYDLVVVDKDAYIAKFGEIITIDESLDTSVKKWNDIGPEISKIIEDIKQSIIDERESYGPKVNENIQSSIFTMLLLTFIGVVFSCFVAVFLVRLILLPVKTITNTFKGIAEGDADLYVRIESNIQDEIGEMSNSFDKFMDKLQVIFSDIKKQNLIKTGQSDLNERLRGEQDTISLGNNIIGYIAHYLNCQIGLIYIKDDENCYNVMSSYAFDCEENISNEINLGEGLISQCALEKRSILITDVPKDYIKISSGIGEAVPRNILVVPCLFDEEVKGIIELGSFQEFSKDQIEFIELVSESIAISINSADSRYKLKELLHKTLEQSEELQMQQEELRQTNEELEEQTNALKESEMILQMQQEELRVTNEELEERSKLLEAQKSDIYNKNKNLQQAKVDIEKKAEALELASKYKSEFLANMSHELRTPLNSILVLSQLLSNKDSNIPFTEKEMEFAKVIHSSGSDLLELINDILDLSKVESGKMEIVLENMNVRDIAEYVKNSFEQIAADKKIRFITEIEEDVPEIIRSDSRRVQQIIKNLLSNAFKFTSKGSVIIKIKPAKEEEVASLDINGNRAITISVTDTGIGIPEDKKQTIFEAFKQSDGTISRKYGGTGLGLSISKELSRVLGGRIYLESKEGIGSTFYITIPDQALVESKVVSKIENEKIAEKTQSIETSIKHKSIKKIINDDRDNIKSEDKCLLIIDDDTNFSYILGTMAKQKGFKYIIASDGNSGIQLAQKFKPNAIVLDIGLPDIDGWEVSSILRNNIQTKNIPVHIISANENETGNTMKNDIIGYLTKPVNLQQLDTLFGTISETIKDQFKKLLIVFKELEQGKNIMKVFENKQISTTLVQNGEEAYRLLTSEDYDCIVLDIELLDMSSYDFLDKFKKKNINKIPIIIYTEKEISENEEMELNKYAKSIIIDGPRSTERLVEEAKLFLYGVNKSLETGKKKNWNIDEKEMLLENKTVLLVDDDMRNVFAVSSILENQGIKVIVGRNGIEALEKISKNPQIDLILMDIMMPEMDGYTAMREIRKMKLGKDIPIIALTAKAMKQDRNKCIESGANDYMVKPVEVEKLLSLIRVWMQK
ncbi:response regulator [Clostridium vincentii]|nr:response regulator [Clostridium vincentii]